VGAWPDAATARSELRAFLNDGPTDRPIKSKILIGPVDGVNRAFYTFEDRIVLGSLVASIEFVDLPTQGVTTATLVDSVIGLISLDAPPPQQTTLRARYYFQYFLDAELDEALRNASGELQESDDITLTPFGLKNSAMNFAGYFAFTKMAIRWAQRMSERLILEDSPVEGGNVGTSNLFNQLAQSYLKNAILLRDSLYMRHGRRNAPAFSVFKPRIPIIAPRR